VNPAVMPTYARADVMFERGEGAYLFDTEGRKYLDFTTGIATASLGHSHPHLVEAIQRQAGVLIHTSNLFRIKEQERLAERLVANSFADTVFFGNSGAEANECAIKTARRYHYANGAPERYRIITFENCFHGRTLATIAATGQAKVLEGFGPKVEGFDQVPLGDMAALKAAIGPETAALMVEPYQGEGGIVPLPDGFLMELRALCDAEGLLLILDEIQTGIGRTGRFLAHEWDGVTPDIVSLGKGIAGGFPVGACLATEEAAKGMVAGTHGSTYGGNPLGMAAANAVLDVVLEDGFLARIEAHGERLMSRLDEVRQRNDSVIEEVRGKGLLVGVKCKVTNMDVVNAMRAHGVLVVPAGDNVVRFLPPLTVGEGEIDEAVTAMEEVCRELGQ